MNYKKVFEHNTIGGYTDVKYINRKELLHTLSVLIDGCQDRLMDLHCELGGSITENIIKCIETGSELKTLQRIKTVVEYMDVRDCLNCDMRGENDG